MKLYKAVLLASGIFTSAVLSFAATPEQSGTWVGTMQSTVYSSTIGKTKAKFAMILEIAEDDHATLTLNGDVVPVLSDTGFYNATGGAFVFGGSFGPVSSSTVANLIFKGTSAKGTATGVDSNGSIFLASYESKIKLKKQ